jgi:hypothetical protein
MTPRANRSGSAAGLAGIVLAGLLALPDGAAAQAFREEFVPGGHVGLEIAQFEQDQDRAFDRSKNLRSLRSYLIPNRGAYAQASGPVERTITETDLRLTAGFSDSTNLFLQLPYLELEQDSRLSTSSSRDDFNHEVDALDSQKLSGLGDLTALLMFRPVFSDRNGFVWGYGITHPLRDRSESDPGLYALALRSPNPRLQTFVHYTRYPRLEHARFDLRLEVQTGLTGRIDTLDEGSQSYRSGTGVAAETGGHFEAGPVGFGGSLEERYYGQSRVDGVGQNDPRNATLLHWRLAFGNLADLEEGPVQLPYQVRLTLDRSLRGFNVPYEDGVTLSILLLF